MIELPDLQVVAKSLAGGDIEVISKSPVSGGSINAAYRLETNRGNYFVKVNSTSLYPGMFEVEEKGLSLLNVPGGTAIPKVYGVHHQNDQAFLLMEYIEPGTRSSNFWKDLATGLAGIHQTHSDEFGLDHDNYMGSLQQVNRKTRSWQDFFTENRLIPQTKLAIEKGLLEKPDLDGIERLCQQLNSIFPEEKPSLVHGDLWSGNYMAGRSRAYLIDPAAYYGHREIDIAMTRLFGGFESAFYEIYNSVYPLAPGWESRVDICNLYPLLIHVNLFGEGYVGSVRRIIRNF